MPDNVNNNNNKTKEVQELIFRLGVKWLPFAIMHFNRLSHHRRLEPLKMEQLVLWLENGDIETGFGEYIMELKTACEKQINFQIQNSSCQMHHAVQA